MALNDDPKIKELQRELSLCHEDLSEFEAVVMQLTTDNQSLVDQNEYLKDAKPGYPFHKITDEGLVEGLKQIVNTLMVCVLMICVAGYFIAARLL